MQQHLKQAGRFLCFLFLTVVSAGICHAAGEDQLITTAKTKDGDVVPYVLNTVSAAPRYVIILFPGSTGVMDPHMEDGHVVYREKNNFLIRARPLIVDDEFATVATNSSSSEQRIQALIDDIKSRFPGAKIYLMGTSRGTYDTMALAGYLSDKIAGEIHTSSLQAIATFNAKKYANRQLIVHHKDDECRATPFSAAQWSHNHYGNDFIAVDGGTSAGDPCEPFSYHGYNGIEKPTIDAIKAWIKQGT